MSARIANHSMNAGAPPQLWERFHQKGGDSQGCSLIRKCRSSDEGRLSCHQSPRRGASAPLERQFDVLLSAAKPMHRWHRHSCLCLCSHRQECLCHRYSACEAGNSRLAGMRTPSLASPPYGSRASIQSERVVVRFGGADIPVCGRFQQTGMSAPPNYTSTSDRHRALARV